MDELDTILMRLSRASVPAALATIDKDVLARVALGTASRVRRNVATVTISAALIMGIVGAVLPSRPAGIAASFAPLGPMPPLSPAALLGDER